MAKLSASDLIQIWEWGQGQPPLQQALVMLAVAYPGFPPEQLAQLPVGQRDGWLLQVRSQTFGPRLQSRTPCPRCAEALEFELDVADITAAPPAQVDRELVADGYCLRWRLPTSADLLAASDEAALLQRCVQECRYEEQAIDVAGVPVAIATQLLAAMAAADPQADVRLNLSCPACGHRWSAVFDIASFLWREIAAQAQRLLEEIHVIAAAYGWSEAAILALSPRRRQSYLEMIQP